MSSQTSTYERFLRRRMREVVLPVATAIALAFTVQAAVAKPYEIPTGSMSPTIAEGDRIIANRIVYKVRPVERGDIVIFRPTDEILRACGQTSSTPFVKRVVGIAGDTVAVRNGLTLVNGREFLVASAIPPTYEKRFRQVPDGSLLLLGDNRNNSCDSHSWPDPFVDKGRVIGQAEITYWPPRGIGFLN